MNKLNNLNDIANIELFQFENPIINNKKNKIKKIIIYSIGFIAYTISLISSTFSIVEYVEYVKPNNCSC